MEHRPFVDDEVVGLQWNIEYILKTMAARGYFMVFIVTHYSEPHDVIASYCINFSFTFKGCMGCASIIEHKQFCLVEYYILTINSYSIV